MNEHRHLHPAEAAPIPTYEIVPLGLIQEDEVLAGGPVPGGAVGRAVIVARLVHLEHVVLGLLVPESCSKEKGLKRKKRSCRVRELNQWRV